MSVSFFEISNTLNAGAAPESHIKPDETLKALHVIMQDATVTCEDIYDRDIETASKACLRILELQQEADFFVRMYKEESQADGLPVSFYPLSGGELADEPVNGSLLEVGVYDLDTRSFTGTVSSATGVSTINLRGQLAVS